MKKTLLTLKNTDRALKCSKEKKHECITGKNPFREGSINALEVLQKTETITPVQYSIKGDTQSQFMALLGAMMGKYPSRRPRTAKQAIDWLKVAKKTFVYE